MAWAYRTRKSTKAKLFPLLFLLIGSIVTHAAAASLLWFVFLYPITEAALWSMTAVTLTESIIAAYRKQYVKWVGLLSLVIVLVFFIKLLSRAF
ncbi:hypothetical protein J23TS9_16470 [Paenibacillus sp. J23TS9]|nr:hypothetical protein J23TS9_16470 [Paenibacillus sp. J23TS9]